MTSTVFQRCLWAKCILAGAAIATALAGQADVANGVRLDTEALKTVHLAASQGIGTDGRNLYAFSTGAVRVYDGNCRMQTIQQSPFSGLNGYRHLGDGSYHNGCLYVSAETYGPSMNASIFVFCATNLSRISLTVVSNWQAEISDVCVDPNFSNHVTLFASSFPDQCHNGHEASFYQYTLTGTTNITFVRKIPYQGAVPKEVQGISYYDGMLYVLGDDNDRGDFYQVNPTNGQTVFLGQLSAPGAREWEGIDTTLGVLMAAANGRHQTMFFNFLPVSRATALSRIGFITGDGQPQNPQVARGNFSLHHVSNTIALPLSTVCLGVLVLISIPPPKRQNR